MKCHSRSILWVCALAVILLGQVFPAMAQTPPIAPPAVECNNGAHDPLAPLCLVVPVQSADGQPEQGDRVTVSYAGRSISAVTGQSIIGPAGEAVAALNLDQIGVRPGDHLQISVAGGATPVNMIIGFQPNPSTHTQQLDPVTIPSQIGPGLIYGAVHLIDEIAPLNDYTIELRQSTISGRLLDSLTVTPGDTPQFSLNPGVRRSNTRLWLIARGAGREARVPITWLNSPIHTRIILDWACVDATPRTGSGGQLPRTGSGGQIDPFCVVGDVISGQEAVAGATLSVTAVDPETGAAVSSVVLDPIQTALPTDAPPGMTKPFFAIDIGPLVATKLPEGTMLRFMAVKDARVGFLYLTPADLGVGQVWGTTLASITLRDIHMGGAGMEGGSPGALAITGSGTGQSTYITTSDGMVLTRQTPGGPWALLLGNPETMLSSPDVSAIAARPGADGEDDLIVALLNGSIVRSRTSGRTWEQTLIPMGVGPIHGLTLVEDTLYVVGARGAARLDAAFTTNPLLVALPLPPGRASAIAADALGHVWLGSSAGLFALAGDTAWQPLRAEALTALALNADNSLLVGTANGLFRTTIDGSGWEDLSLHAAIQAVVGANAGAEAWAISSSGIWRGTRLVDDSIYTWQLDTPTELTEPEPTEPTALTIGRPTIFDLAASGERLIAASSTGVWVSDDGGLNWARLNPAFAHDVRAIDLLPDEAVLALGPDGLFLVTADSIRTLTDSPALSLTDLNPAAVQQTSDGDILIGRHAGPGLSLWVYDHTSSAWHQATVGEGRGISAIEAFSTPRAGMAAVIATDGDGLFGWSPGGLSQFPALLGADGQPLRIGALLVSETGSDCSIIVGTVGPARIVSRPCDLSGAWDAPLDLMTRAAQQVGGVSALIRVGSRMFAATSEGFFRGTLAGPWQPIFGLPTRPLALAAPADYELSRTLVAGGPQSGPILLFDSAPDIDVRLECPTELLGDTSGTCTATLTNQGLLPIPAGSLAVQLSGSSIALIGPAEVAYPQLETGSLFSTTLTLAVARDARPGKAHLDVTAPAAPAEGFTANNHIGTSIQIAYRNGADPAIVIGGQTMTRPTTKARLNLTVSNGGTLAMGAPARLSLTLPDNVLIDAIGDGALVSPGVVSWDVPDLEAGERIVLPLTYHLAADVQPDNILTVTATLLPQGDDREPTNNGDVAQLQLIPAQPIVLALTNMTRLARRGPVTEARAELASYLADAPGIEIPLDAAPPCETNHSSLACYYDAWDQATSDLAQAWHDNAADSVITSQVQQLADARRHLSEAIVSYVIARLRSTDAQSLTSIYLVGDDDVIPYGAVLDITPDNTGDNPEWKYAASLQVTDTLFGLYRSNSYPSDWFYQQIGTDLVPSRQPGNPQEIAAALKLYRQLGGTLLLNHGLIAGAAKDLTEDAQQQICLQMKARGLPLAASCTTDLPVVSTALPGLSDGGSLLSASEHASRIGIGDTRATDFGALGLSKINLILFLGCHSGVSSGDGMNAQATLTTELGRQGQPTIGYLGYAYAAGIPGAPLLAYAEELQLRLTMRMLGGDVMLAEAFGQAIADYGPVTTARNKTEHEKTLDTIALFGPPTYRITWAGAATTPAVQPLVLAGAATAPAAALATGTQPTDTSSVQHVPANPNPTLDLTISYTPQSVAFGQLYQAQSSIGTASLMVDRNLPLQPYIDILLDQPISGALIRSASFIEYSGVDPVIPIVAPLDQAIPYTEPEYQGGSVDRATWLRTYVDGDGRSHLIVLAGQWFVRNHRERLLQRLSLELLPAPHERDHHDSGNRDHGDYGRGGDDGYDRYHNTHRYWNNDRNSEREISHVDRARACWRDRTFRSVHVQVGDSEGLARIEVVMIADGHFTVFPMRHSEERWAATIRITPGATYFIQRVDQSGYVSFDPNGGDLYQVPQEVPCTCEQPDHEAGAHEEG